MAKDGTDDATNPGDKAPTGDKADWSDWWTDDTIIADHAKINAPARPCYEYVDEQERIYCE